MQKIKSRKGKSQLPHLLGWRSNWGIADLEMLADELDEWSKLPTSIRYYDFAMSKNIARTTFQCLTKQNAKLFEAFERAKIRCAAHREDMAIKGTMNDRIFVSTAKWHDPYSHEHDEIMHEREKEIVNIKATAQQTQKGTSEINVVEMPTWNTVTLDKDKK